jgi:hypothetical protein
MESNIILNEEEEKNSKSFSFLSKKTKRNYILTNTEILDESNKILLLKKISKLRKRSEINEKIQKYNKFISFLESNNIGDLDIIKFNELLGVNEIINPKLLTKKSNGYLISYFREHYYDLFFYKIPKLIGKLKHINNLSIYLCFTNNQLKESLKKKDYFEYENYFLNNSSLLEYNIFDNNKILSNINDILFIVNRKVNFDLNTLKKTTLLTEIKETNKVINPLSINLGFFYYIDDVLLKHQNEYTIIISEKRKGFIDDIIDFVNNPLKKFYYITGEKGGGKTVTLLYFSGLNIYNKFYFNFKSFFKQSKDNTKQMMKYEVMRLFNFSYEKTDENIQKIENLIENFEFSKIQDFLESIIYFSCQFFDYKESVTIIFILDQYNTNINNFNIDTFKEKINSYMTNNNIKIII